MAVAAGLAGTTNRVAAGIRAILPARRVGFPAIADAVAATRAAIRRACTAAFADIAAPVTAERLPIGCCILDCIRNGYCCRSATGVTKPILQPFLKRTPACVRRISGERHGLTGNEVTGEASGTRCTSLIPQVVGAAQVNTGGTGRGVHGQAAIGNED